MSDWIDKATAASEQHQSDALERHNRRRVPQRESRMYCIDCEEEIPQKRREAVIGCQRCLACQSVFERGGA